MLRGSGSTSRPLARTSPRLPFVTRLTREAVATAGRIVVKVGSSSLTTAAGGLDVSHLDALVLALAPRTGVVLVSSGAIAAGLAPLGLSRRPRDLATQQAAASVGQAELVHAYSLAFGRHGRTVGQVLLTADDVVRRSHYRNAQTTLDRLLALGVVPVVNENDAVATDEIRFGDNDTLGSLVTNLVEADVLVILTDQPGLYSADPRTDPSATLIADARAGDPALEAMAGGAGSHIGSGGMLTKVLAARRASRSGAHTVIASGREPGVLTRLARGERVGSQLVAQTMTLAARKQWIADHLQVRGRLTLDAGAAKAVVADGKSLLPIGVYEIAGEFERGEVVSCADPAGREIARGLINYNATEARRILRTATSDIESRLGYIDEAELIHRDNLVLL